ncbi:MAG: MFS transporter [Caldilineaceae bacterium]|nr:MFS transporter [Caldilineaceae bacterium]
MNAVSPTKAGRKEWIGLAVIALPCLLYSLDLTVLNLAVPAMSADLKPSSSQLLWIVDIYGFMVAGSLLIMGTLGDRIGRQKLLLIGAAAFGIASILAAFSNSAAMLIATRALLGVAGATLAPSTLSLIRSMFHDADERTVAIGIWGTSFAAGGAVGPLVGGVLLEYFWWGSVFLVGVPVMVLLLIVGPILLPEYRDPKAGRLDFISAGMSLVAVLPAIYGLKQIAQDGWGWLPALSIVTGLVVGTLFVQRQRTLADPLLDLRLFANRAFSASVVTNTLGVFVAFGGFLYVAQYMQLVLELSPLQAGLWSLPGTLAVVVTSNLAPVIVRRVRPVSLIVLGLLLAGAGYGMLARAGGDSALAIVVIANIVMSAGFGLIFILTADMVVSSAPPERAGAASAISETGSEFGGALGIAILGSIGTAVYRGVMAQALPSGIPHEAAEVARDTIGGAVAAAAQLPGPLGAALLNAAQDAFTQGLHLTAVINVVLMAGAALLAALLLRDVRRDSGIEEQPHPAHPDFIHPDSIHGGVEPVLVPVVVRNEPRA